jgi:hypothetical protein
MGTCGFFSSTPYGIWQQFTQFSIISHDKWFFRRGIGAINLCIVRHVATVPLTLTPRWAYEPGTLEKVKLIASQRTGIPRVFQHGDTFLHD